MCGINGIYGLEKIESPKEVISKMNHCLAHRGPDAEGIFTDDFIALGHKRLSIIGTDSSGNQPIFSKDKNLVLVFNGEIYNYLEIREELPEYDFQTETDTEVLIAAYEKWGIACLQKLNGMFAFALWNKSSRDLLIARDRIGIKPLYYSQQGNSIIFSSEIRSVLASGLVNRRLDRNSIDDYLRYQTVHAPNTLIEGVHTLESGSYLIINDNEVSQKAYWKVDDSRFNKATYSSKEEIQNEIASLMRSSVALRMRADVPYGAFLSGGIDSSIIVALMSEVNSQKVKTFSVTFQENEFTEAPYSRMIADKYNTDHTEIELSVNDFLKEVPNALDSMDHPSGDGPNTYVVSKVCKEAGVTMALSGLGGDELFAGYPVFKRSVDLLDKRFITSFPKFLRKSMGGALTAVKPGIVSEKKAEVLTLDYMDLEHSYPIARKVLLDKHISKLLNKEKLNPNKVQELVTSYIGHQSGGMNLPFLSQISTAEMFTYMQNVLLRDSDQMSMAHALEVRVPFLDHRLVEYALSIPDQIKYPHTQKKLLVDSFKDLLPEEIYNRPKMGFTIPFEVWMKNELKDFCIENLEALAAHEAFNSNVMALWEEFLSGSKTITWSRIWHMVVLGSWIKKHDIN